MSEDTFDVTRPIDVVKQHVADNPDQLQTVLDAEKARGDDARKTLVEYLEGEVARIPQPSEPSPVTVAPGTNDVQEKSILGETYTVDPLKGYRVKVGQPSKNG